eukprot:scaffold82507_cov72-Phaeocystis_antarctica.AAC.1
MAIKHQHASHQIYFIKPCAAPTRAAPARDSRGTAAFASRRGRTHTDGHTARRGASSDEPCTRCMWSRRR